MKIMKTIFTMFLLITAISHTAFTDTNDTSNSPFLGGDNADISNILEMSVATLRNVYYSADISDN